MNAPTNLTDTEMKRIERIKRGWAELSESDRAFDRERSRRLADEMDADRRQLATAERIGNEDMIRNLTSSIASLTRRTEVVEYARWLAE